MAQRKPGLAVDRTRTHHLGVSSWRRIRSVVHAANPNGTKLEGTVREVDAKGAIIDIAEGGSESPHAKSTERVDDASRTEVGDRSQRAHGHGPQGPHPAARSMRRTTRKCATCWGSPVAVFLHGATTQWAAVARAAGRQQVRVATTHPPGPVTPAVVAFRLSPLR